MNPYRISAVPPTPKNQCTKDLDLSWRKRLDDVEDACGFDEAGPWEPEGQGWLRCTSCGLYARHPEALICGSCAHPHGHPYRPKTTDCSKEK